MAQFVRCLGKAYCVETPEGCRTCGRSTAEIETTRSLVAQAAHLILKQNYENPGEFTSYLAEKIARKVRHAGDTDR